MPKLPEHQVDCMNEFFDDIKLLTSFIGCEIFEVIEFKESDIIFSFETKECSANGIYSEKGFTVLKDSILSPRTLPSFGWKEARDSFIKKFTKEI